MSKITWNIRTIMKNNDIFIKFVKRWLISHYSEFTYKRYFVRDLKNNGTYILKLSKVPNIEVYIENDFNLTCGLQLNMKIKAILQIL